MAALSGAPRAGYNLEFPMLLKLMELNFHQLKEGVYVKAKISVR